MEQKPARLQDVLNYPVEGYFTNDEIAWIRNTFKDSSGVNILRKALLPSIGSPDLPLEEALGNDFWLTGIKWEQIPEAEVKSLVLARQDIVKFIVGGLVKLKIIANAGGTAKTAAETAADSSK